MRRRTFLGLLGLLGCKDELEDMKINKKLWWLGTSQSGAIDTDYQAYLDEIDSLGYVAPPSDVQTAQNQFILDLKAAGLWSRMKTGYFFHNEDERTNRVNLKTPGTYALTLVNNTAIDPINLNKFGMRSAGASYYRQPFGSNEYAGIAGDLTIIQYMPRNVFNNTFTTSYNTGFRHTATGNTAMIARYDASIGYRYGGEATLRSFPNASEVFGLYVLSNTLTESNIYKDGTKTSASRTPVTPTLDNDRAIFCTNTSTTNGGFTASATMNLFIACDFLFDAFDDTDESTFRTIWNTYITSIGLDNSFVTEYASHCWFASEKAVYDSVTNKSWFGQVSAGYGLSYRQTIYEVNHATGAFSRFQLGTAIQKDDHNEPSIIIRDSDSKLMCAYSEHSGSVIRTRISTNAKDASSWASEVTFDPDGTSLFTYPSLFQSSSGNLYIFFRNTKLGVNTWKYVKSTDGGTSWGSVVHLHNMTYSRIAQDPNDKDKLYFIVTEHPDELTSPSYVGSFMFDCSTDKPYLNDGTTDISSLMPLDFADMDEIFSTSDPENVWLEDITVDSTGKPRVLFSVLVDNTTDQLLKDEYYSEWNGSAWTTPYKLHRSTTHHMETELLATDLLNKTYSPLGTFDRSNPDRIFSSIETAGDFGDVCEIWELIRVSSSSFTRTQKTFNSKSDQWRPFTTGSPSSQNVYWLDKKYYDHWFNEYYQVLRYGSF